jgi:hypothetical protein
MSKVEAFDISFDGCIHTDDYVVYASINRASTYNRQPEYFHPSKPQDLTRMESNDIPNSMLKGKICYLNTRMRHLIREKA